MQPFFISIALAGGLFASQAAAVQPLDDEFSASTPHAGWKRLEQTEGWATTVRSLAVDPKAGLLRIDPLATSWADDWHGAYLYQEVEGDFVVTAKVRATGHAAPLPGELWSLTGLMVRAPREITPGSWIPRNENWLHITAGVADAAGVYMIETKSVVNSVTNLKLLPVEPEWLELRVARFGPSFMLLYRRPGEPWRLRERLYRNDLPARLQVGVSAYSNGRSAYGDGDPVRFNSTAERGGRPDLVADVDYVRFSRPSIPAGAPAWFKYTLTDYDVPDSRILDLIGA